MLTDYNFSAKVVAKLVELNPMEEVELSIDIVGEGKKFVGKKIQCTLYLPVLNQINLFVCCRTSYFY